MYVHRMHAWYPGRLEVNVRSLKLLLQLVVSCHMVLGTEPLSSGRALKTPEKGPRLDCFVCQLKN